MTQSGNLGFGAWPTNLCIADYANLHETNFQMAANPVDGGFPDVKTHLLAN